MLKFDIYNDFPEICKLKCLVNVQAELQFLFSMQMKQQASRFILLIIKKETSTKMYTPF